MYWTDVLLFVGAMSYELHDNNPPIELLFYSEERDWEQFNTLPWERPCLSSHRSKNAQNVKHRTQSTSRSTVDRHNDCSTPTMARAKPIRIPNKSSSGTETLRMEWKDLFSLSGFYRWQTWPTHKDQKTTGVKRIEIIGSTRTHSTKPPQTKAR